MTKDIKSKNGEILNYLDKDKVFFTADTHFGSQRHLDLCFRPFETIEEMDSEMIKRWNKLVPDDGIVFHLGDFGDLNFDNLNGRIILIPGNYDFDKKGLLYPKLAPLLDFKYTYITKHGGSDLVHIENEVFQLVHDPLKAQDCSLFYLFGHIHMTQKIKRRGLNVGVDCHNFTPITFETVMFHKKSIENVFAASVFCGN